MKLLPAPPVNFIVVQPTPLPVHQLMIVRFWYQRTRYDSYRHLLGCFVGNALLDEKFEAKMTKVRLKLAVLGVIYYDYTSEYDPEAVEEHRRMTTEARKQRKIGMAMREYERRRQAIDESSDLFKDDKYSELEGKLKATLEKIEEIYKPENQKGRDITLHL